MVECGGLENRFTGNPGDEGSNPSSSAIFFVSSKVVPHWEKCRYYVGIRTLRGDNRSLTLPDK